MQYESDARGDSARLQSEFSRQCRARVYGERQGELTGVWDTVEVPFEARDFPRGQLLIQAMAPDQQELSRQVSHLMREKGLVSRLGQMEVLKAPASTHRCRLYRLRSIDQVPTFTEVWDTVEEPCEYRHDMPEGDLVGSAEDFSRRFVRQSIATQRAGLGVRSAGIWKQVVTA